MPREANDAKSTVRDLSLESKKSRIRRKALGIYYTPPQAARVLARWAIKDARDVVLEPSFGGCSLLDAAVSVFESLGNTSPSEQLFGFDVDAKAFEHLAEMGIQNHNGNFKKADFLRSQGKCISVDAVLANPPFIAYHRQNPSQRTLTEKLRNKYFPSLPRFASLWAYFILHSMSFLRPGGRMAFVLPAAISTADYGRVLLDHLRQKFQQVEVLLLSERLFIQAGADERIALLLLSEYTPNGVVSPLPVDVREVLRINDMADSILMPKIARTDGYTAFDALNILKRSALTELGTVASVQIGEVVGDIRFFVRSKKSWEEEGVPEEFLLPILTRSSQTSDLFINSDSVKSPESQIPYLLLPPVAKLSKKLKSLLTVYDADSIKENRTFQKRQVWYRCSYVVNADAFIGSMNHEWPRIIGNGAKISCSNSYYKIILGDDAKDYRFWLPLISLTTPFRLSVELLGRVRGSGGVKLEPSDVRQLLIPSRLPEIRIAALKKLCKEVNAMVSNGDVDSAAQLADAIIYLNPGVIDISTMDKLRRQRTSLANKRMLKI